MTQKESEYRATLKWAEKKYGLTEEEFLYLYYLKDDEEKEKEYAKFPRKMRYGIVHLQAAYCGYLMEQEELKEKIAQEESEYRRTLKYFGKKYGLTEEKFLYLYSLKAEEREKEYAKLPESFRYEIIHLQAAYNVYLRAQKKFKDKNDLR